MCDELQPIAARGCRSYLERSEKSPRLPAGGRSNENALPALIRAGPPPMADRTLARSGVVAVEISRTVPAGVSGNCGTNRGPRESTIRSGESRVLPSVEIPRTRARYPRDA